MAASQPANFNLQEFTDVGQLLVGGRLYTYGYGTTAQKTAFTDPDGTVPHTYTPDGAGGQYIALNARGELPAPLYLGAGSYDLALKRADGSMVWTRKADGVDNQVQALTASPGSSLIGFIQNGVGATKRTAQDKLRDTVSVADFGAKGDGVTDDTNAFANAAAYAGSVRADVVAPPPSVFYLLNSDPACPANVNVRASPDWFSGPGKMPFHKFTSLSEGVDPRTFSIKGMHFAQTEPNESKRKWALVGWVDNANAPAAGSVGTATDAVGVDGRARSAAANARSWGGVFLAQLDPGVSGQAQVYSLEADVNNNFAHSTQDGSPTAKGIVMASGGSFRPEVAHFIIATRTPANNLGDNRFMHGLRFYRDSCMEANIFIDDANAGDAMRIPNSSRGIHWTSNANLVNYYLRVSSGNNHLELTIDQNQAFDFYNSANQKILSIKESSFEPDKPVGLSEFTYQGAGGIPASVNASLADVITFGAAGVIAGGITGGIAGQVFTLINASGGAVTINRNANMRTAGGAAVVLNNLQSVQFVFTGGTYFQIGTPVANA